MSVIRRMLRQKAVYWPPPIEDEHTGIETQPAPIEIAVRWHDIDIDIVMSTGTIPDGGARVFVDRDLHQGGVLWLGKLADIAQPTTEPFANQGAFFIRRVDRLPNVKANEFLREVLLGL